MRIVEYTKLRTGVQLNARRANLPEVRSTALGLQQALMASGRFTSVEVDWTNDVDHLVVAMCSFDASLTEEQVARQLEDLWLGELRFGYWAAHSTLVTPGQVELQGATLRTIGGPYLTLHVIAQKARIPAQRVPSE